LSKKSVLLIIGGGIAAYKSLELIREFKRRGIAVRGILTQGGAEFVTPLSVASLSGEQCFTDLFDLKDEAEMGHIELSRSADMIVVAPATADLMAKLANGLANDLASTALLATDKPVMMAPAMNVRMWEHAATRRNHQQLREDGILFVGPDEGDMACGEYGFGRMAEPLAIADAAEQFLIASATGALRGKKILITAGPTHEPIDPVRYLANRSSGRQGYAIAIAAARAGAKVKLISGPTDLPDPVGVKTIRVETAREMLKACEKALPVDVAIFCAAVADYRPSSAAREKIKKDKGGLDGISLAENPDILKTIAKRKKGRPALVIGFAAETETVLRHAKEKRKRKGCDWIIANDVSPDALSGTNVMGGARNQVSLISDSGTETWPEMDKQEVADRLIKEVAKQISIKRQR
jgi:phosphopantothenoylcysteine decarboxylase / phosphopantothenate---cysteine ligase